MFAKLFAEGGLSLDRLRALLEVSATGSIVKAAGGDPVRQSQFSRQIKELEDFFQAKLIERHGKGIRLTASGKELARISRFFLLGLSNFRRGCLAEEQTFRIGASASVTNSFLLPTLALASTRKSSPSYVVETLTDTEIESRLHDLTLDFGVVTQPELSRPLQLKKLARWKLLLWTPRSVCSNPKSAVTQFRAGRLPLVIATETPDLASLNQLQPRLSCPSFADVQSILRTAPFTGLLPDYLRPVNESDFISTTVPRTSSRYFHHHLAWNPRLLRLNPHAVRVRDSLLVAVAKLMNDARF